MSGWSRLRRALFALLAVGGLALFGWLSVQVYRSKVDPEGFRAWDGPYAWIVGPPARALEEAAQKRMQTGLRFLEDTSRPAPERIRLYREELRRAEALLVRSLRAQPAQARALAALAAVRWELEPPQTPEATRKHLHMIALASRMAPTYPDVQLQLGELLLKMGRRDEALTYLARTVELDPDTSRQVIGLLADYLFQADEMLAGLPPGPLVLAYLGGPFAEESRDDDYLDLLETTFGRAAAEVHPALLTRYGNTCLRRRAPERLLRQMDAIGRQPDAPVEAERLKQRARALVTMGQPIAALHDASRARDLQPDLPARAEFVGDVSLAAGEADAAAVAFRDALRRMAKAKAGARTRARLYRKIGQCEEERGRPDLAYDAHRRALELNPDEPVSRKRIEAMERAAGFD